MFKITGTFSFDLCFSHLIIWHILWLKRGSRCAWYHVPIFVSLFICCKLESRYKCVCVLLWEQNFFCEQI